MFCFTFVSDHNTDYIMLYSVQLKNMYSYLNSSLKLSDIVRGLLSTIVLQLIIIIQIHHHTGPRSAVGNVSGYRCVSNCRSRGREFDPGPVPYFRGD